MTEGGGYDLRDEHEDGAYAEGIATWFSPFALVLDFTVPVHPSYGAGFDADGQPLGRTQVAARVRMPMAMAFEMIREISDTMARYEEAYGEIGSPRRREEGSG